MLNEKSMLVVLHLGMIGNSTTDAKASAELQRSHGSADGRLTARKKLFAKTNLDPKVQLHRKIRKYHHDKTLPWGNNNERLLPTASYLGYVEQLRQFRLQDDKLTEDFILNYRPYVDQARHDLGTAFNADDYYSECDLREQFGMDTSFKPVPDAGDWRISLQREAMDELRNQLNTEHAAAERAARNDLLRRIAEPLCVLVNRLSDPEAKLQTRSTAAFLDNVRAVCDVIPALNITQDAEIEAIRKQIFSTLYQANPVALTESAPARGHAMQKAQEILTRMESYFGAAEAVSSMAA